MAAGGGSDDELKLLGFWASPFVHRARVALHLKGITGYEYAEEDLTSKSDLLLASNPVHAKVPVLLHGGKPVCESMLIVQYLDEAFPGSGSGPALLPADPHDRAVARFWAAYADDHFFASWIKAFAGTTDEERAAATEAAAAALQKMEGAFGECSKGKAFFGGDAPGYVDIALGGYVAWMRAFHAVAGVDLLDAARTPLLAAWAERFAALDAAKEVIPDVDRIAEFAKRDLLPLLQKLHTKTEQ
ncbi:probable glutathione S-transferase GSTU6 [Hordeum vulgare subsp. vulgare]|uniref:Glutathione S-transferase n=1 Tax=Hordeum vulgare subsp. vulgare TaxID=112509 RepID=A0A8I6WYJ9_HORVV|nr:probable glutathione S-transferase GSTU6 [Hordeum vulgare subsp. vulgare]